MLDGQNIFDAATAYSDEWQVDEVLEELAQESFFQEMIVVGIPNGQNRFQEYNPWDYQNKEGKMVAGRGKRTMAFIVETLKPFIDSNYRTVPEQTGIAGSSLGGLMALYAGIHHQQTFQFIGAFSPTLSMLNEDNHVQLFQVLREKQTPYLNNRFYIDMGKVEYGNYRKVEELERLLTLLHESAETEIKVVKDDLGRHCELDWSKRLPQSLAWLNQGIG